MRLAVSAFCLLMLVLPEQGTAQRLAELPSTWTPHPMLAAEAAPPALIKVGDYRVEGTVVGGALLGALGLWIGGHGCGGAQIPEAPPPSTTGCVLSVGAVGLVAGAGVGYLLGWSLPKYRQMEPQ